MAHYSKRNGMHGLQSKITTESVGTWSLVSGTEIFSFAKAPMMSSEWFRRCAEGLLAPFSAFFAFFPCQAHQHRHIHHIEHEGFCATCLLKD